MKKLTKKEKEILIEKLKPFWNRLWELELDNLNKIKKLENKMNKKVKVKTKLEFFKCDGDYCGIGAENYSDRKWFPLIHDTRLFSN